jgi:hypothetical protein
MYLGRVESIYPFSYAYPAEPGFGSVSVWASVTRTSNLFKLKYLEIFGNFGMFDRFNQLLWGVKSLAVCSVLFLSALYCFNTDLETVSLVPVTPVCITKITKHWEFLVHPLAVQPLAVNFHWNHHASWAAPWPRARLHGSFKASRSSDCQDSNQDRLWHHDHIEVTNCATSASHCALLC